MPFWAIFKIIEDKDGLHLLFSFHLPKFKLLKNEKTVKSRLEEMSKLLKERVRALVLLLEISKNQNKKAIVNSANPALLTSELKLSPNLMPILKQNSGD